MKTQLSTFNFHSNSVRVVIDPNNEYWFCGKDVCDILGYENSRLTIKKHCKSGGVSKRYTPTESSNQEMIFINEPNLYRLIIKSRKPEAEPFETWVMEEVLPTIRKTGQYQLKQQQLALPEPEPLRRIKITDHEFEALLVVLNKFTPMAQQFAEIVKTQHRQLYDVLGLERHVRNPTAAKAHDIAYEFNYWINLARNAINR